MVQISLSSAPCASAEQAEASLNSLINLSGRDGAVSVLSMTILEADGAWVAMATVRVERPEKTDDAKDISEDEIEKIRAEAALTREDTFVVPYYLMPQEPSVADRSFPVELEDIDTYSSTETVPILVPDILSVPKAEDINSDHENNVLMGEKESLSPDASALADQVIAEFNNNEPPPPVSLEKPSISKNGFVGMKPASQDDTVRGDSEETLNDDNREILVPEPEALPAAAPPPPPA
jgi:hypothetical protein